MTEHARHDRHMEREDSRAAKAAANVKTDWNPILRREFDKPYWDTLQGFVSAERSQATVYPPADRVFAALHLTPYAATRVMMSGELRARVAGARRCRRRRGCGGGHEVAQGRRRCKPRRGVLSVLMLLCESSPAPCHGGLGVSAMWLGT